MENTFSSKKYEFIEDNENDYEEFHNFRDDENDYIEDDLENNHLNFITSDEENESEEDISNQEMNEYLKRM